TGIPQGKAFEMKLNVMRTTLETRWDTIYSYHPVPKSKGQKDGNGVPMSAVGSCLRSKLVTSPYINPNFEADLGLEWKGFGDHVEISIFNPRGLFWRPWQVVVLSADGNGDKCLSQEERQQRNDSGSSVSIPDDEPDDTEPALKVDASWMSNTDVDLEVKSPEGTHFGTGRTKQSGAAKFPHDVCGGDIPCTGPDEANTESLVYHPARAAPSGTYKVRVTNDNGNKPAQVELQIRNRGNVFDTATVQLSGSSGASSGWIQLEK
ncbi:MAG: hypothetical protein ABEN55_20200, partial [Bradymonadaceae bacterium]